MPSTDKCSEEEEDGGMRRSRPCGLRRAPHTATRGYVVTGCTPTSNTGYFWRR